MIKQTASQKRAKSKRDKEGYIKDLEEFLNINMPVLENLPPDKLQIEEVDESYGDEWYSEIRVGYTFFFPDKTAYTFAYVNTIEDDENWAQAESYSSIDFREYYDSNKITVNELITKLKKVL